MVPLIKGYSTEMSLEATSLGVQVHGGMGFIEETGAAQHYRDAKILTIYEGTTAIQANDLVGRKTARDGGATVKAICAQIESTERQLAAASPAPTSQAVARRLGAGRQALAGRRGLHRRRRQGQPQRGVRRQRPLPDAGRQCGGGLADGTSPGGGRRPAGHRAKTPTSCAPRSPPPASTPTTSSARRPGPCATASSRAPRASTEHGAGRVLNMASSRGNQPAQHRVAGVAVHMPPSAVGHLLRAARRLRAT